MSQSTMHSIDNLHAKLMGEAVGRRIQWMVLATLLFCFAGPAAWALDPSQPPAANFDLSHWKLTLPDATASDIGPTQLEAGATNEFFYTGPDGAMTFWCPVTGGVTRLTTYPRCELRELLDPGSQSVDWSGYGTNILNAQCRVTQVPSSGRVIIGQIHSFTGNAYPLVKLQFDKGRVTAKVRESPNSSNETVFALGNVGISNLLTYQLKLEEGLLSMTVNGSNQAVNVFQTDPAWNLQTFYFKAGNYCQDNSGPTNEGAVVAFYQLEVEHHLPSTVPVIMFTNCALNAAGDYSLTLLGPGSGNYFVQTSTDLSNWSHLLMTNSISGEIAFTDAMAPGARFYRGGMFSAPVSMQSAAEASGNLRFTLIGPGGVNYFIQSSTNMVE